MAVAVTRKLGLWLLAIWSIEDPTRLQHLHLKLNGDSRPEAFGPAFEYHQVHADALVAHPEARARHPGRCQ